MDYRSFVKSFSLVHSSVLCFILAAGCQSSDSAPNVGSTPSGNTAKPDNAATAGSDASDKSDSKPAASEDKVTNSGDKKPAGGTDTNAGGQQTAPLPEAKQTEVKGLLAGSWSTACNKIENPDVAGQFFSSIESWKVAADGTIEASYQDFDDAACQTPSQGFENYVFAVSKPVALKELGSKHFYIEMNVSKELNESGTLADATGKYLIMVKFETGSMSIDFVEDMTATALSAEAVKFTKK